MAELHYAFIKNGIVEQVAVFAEKNEELADQVARDLNFDDAVWVGEDLPTMYSSYDGKTFTAPTLDYLYERGFANENSKMLKDRLAAEEAAKATDAVK
jgi:hypothetical protein